MKFVKIMLFMAVAAVFTTACGKKSNKLVMATQATFPPYEFFQGDQIVGIDVDIVREAAKRAGYELEVQDMNFDAVIPSVQQGKADIAASGITVTEDRKKNVDFTISYVKAHQMIIVPADSTITKAEDLKGKRVGVQHGTTGAQYVTTHFQEPEPFENGGLATAALQLGKVDVVVLDEDPAKVHVSKSEGKLKILPEPLTTEEYAYAIKKGRTELYEPFNNALKEMEKEGFFKKTIEKYKDTKKAE